MKKTIIIIGLILFSFSLQAQTRSGSIGDVLKGQGNQSNQNTQNANQPSGFRKENLRFGGTFGANIGNDVTLIDISPTVGYQFSPRFQAGLGVIYNYYSLRNQYTGKRVSTNVFGGSSYGQFTVVKAANMNFFVRGEFNAINHITGYTPGGNEIREWVTYPLIGGGLLLPFGGTGAISVQLLYNLNESEKSIYENPIFRVGIVFGF
jgi:hypothetical protein